MQTAVTPDCLVSALISLPVPPAPDFQRLEPEESFPAHRAPAAQENSLSAREGRAGRKAAGAARERTQFVPAFGLCPSAARGCFSFTAALAAAPWPGSGHRAARASDTCGPSPLSPALLLRIGFYASGSAVIFFIFFFLVGQASFSFRQICRVWLCRQLGRACWPVALGGLARGQHRGTQMSCSGPPCGINSSPSRSHKPYVKLLMLNYLR